MNTKLKITAVIISVVAGLTILAGCSSSSASTSAAASSAAPASTAASASATSANTAASSASATPTVVVGETDLQYGAAEYKNKRLAIMLEANPAIGKWVDSVEGSCLTKAQDVYEDSAKATGEATGFQSLCYETTGAGKATIIIKHQYAEGVSGSELTQAVEVEVGSDGQVLSCTQI